LLDDASASTPQEDFPSDVVTNTHHEPILDKDKLKSDTSATSKCFLFNFNFFLVVLSFETRCHSYMFLIIFFLFL
jgi:hypothetical protein